MKDDLITVGEVAALADERPNTVSTWRGRYPDFPAGTRQGRQVVFPRREVVRWLERRRPGWDERDGGEAGSSDAVRQIARSEPGTEAGLSLICLASLAPRQLMASLRDPLIKTIAALSQGVEVEHGQPGLLTALQQPDTVRFLSDAAPLVVAPDRALRPAAELRDTFEALLAQGPSTSSTGRSAYRSPEWLSELMFDLISAAIDGHDVLLDPAAGEGGFLLAGARRAATPLRLVGWELEPNRARLAHQRLLVHGQETTIRVLDSLGPDALTPIGASGVMCDPPLSLRVDAERWEAADPRWRDYALPDAHADLAWVLLALHHLLPGGRAAILTTRGALTRQRNEGVIRRRLIEAGAVEAIIALPAGSVLQAGVPMALWLLHKPQADQTRDVLFIDATDAAIPRRSSPSRTTTDAAPWLAETIRATVEEWRSSRDRTDLQGGFAAVHPAVDLVVGDANLDPGRLVHLPASPHELASELCRTREEHANLLAKLSAIPSPSRSHTGPAVVRRMKIAQLLASGRVELITGQRLEPSADGGGGVPVLGSWTFHGAPPRRSPHATPVLRTGDVVIAARGREFQAHVADATDEGAALQSPVQALRLIDTDDEELAALTPSLLAELISVARGSTGTVGRQTVKTIEIPILTPDAAHELDLTLVELRRESELSERLGIARDRLRTLLVEQFAR